MAEQAPNSIEKNYWPDLTKINLLPKISQSQNLPKKVAFQTQLVRCIVQFILAILLSRAMFPNQIFPGAAPFVIVRRSIVKRLEEWLIILGTFFGTLSVTNLENAVWVSGSLLVLNFSRSWCRRLVRTSLQGLLLFGVWVVLRLLMTLIRESNPAAFFLTGFELMFSGVLTLFFQWGFNLLANPSKITKWSTLGLAIIAVVALSGTAGLRIFSLELSEISLVFLLITVAYLGGGGAGSSMGVLIALVLGIASGGLVAEIGLLAISGFLAGLLKDFGKWGTIFGASLGFFLISRQPQMEMAFNTSLVSWGMGMSGFALMPQRFLSQISEYSPERSEKTNSVARQQKLKEVISGRLSGVAKIFEEMVRDFNGETCQNEVSKIDLYSLLDQVCTKNCKHCNGYEMCWEKNFYSTYRELFDLLACAELYGEVTAQHLKGKLRQSCYQQYKLITTVNFLFEKFQTELFWRRKYEVGKNLISQQLQGVSNFINDLAEEVITDQIFKDGFEASIKYSLNKLGIATQDIAISSFRDEGLEIKITQKGCKRCRECQNLIVPMLNSILGQKYMVWNKQCYQNGGQCTYQLIPEFKFEIQTTVCKLPKCGNEHSGDNHAMHQLKDGHFVAVLSDGMGHGRKASEESRITVSMLERLLENGIARDFAVRMVNSMMALRSPEESFATVDLTLVDLYTAKAEFIKIGAAATYIKRGREVWPIKSTSLPAGILNTVDVERTVSQLQSGDLIIMVTDGIVDSKADKVNKEDWIVRALSKVEVVGPEALGEYLLNLARINQDGQPKDDMTVVVLQINRQGEEE